MSEIANRITGVDKVSDNNQHFDLVVIGAGINGLGIARDAAERGLKVCLKNSTKTQTKLLGTKSFTFWSK